MKKKFALITGSGGLVGSEAVRFLSVHGFTTVGVDNNMRKFFFGPEGSVESNIKSLRKTVNNYIHVNSDIRDEKTIQKLFSKYKFDLVIHSAAQPSHDWASRDPLTDFDINSRATLVLLENFKKYSPESVFIFTSTNKVYGDRVNSLPFVELKTRYELPQKHSLYKGIDETMSVDCTTHSFLGSSKLAADILVQEYGRYFNLKTTVFRAGCITGRQHSGAKLHGFLSYLGKSVYKGELYEIIGYKGKQVRDNIHAFDLVSAFYDVYKKPKCGEVYNIGGTRHSNISILEAIGKFEQIFDKKAKIKVLSTPRKGDHKWYISKMDKFKKDYPKWKFTYTTDSILEDIAKGIIVNT